MMKLLFMEASMFYEKRRFERYPAFGTMQLQCTDDKNDRCNFPVKIYNRSQNGFGAVFRGTPPQSSQNLTVVHDNEVLQGVELVWTNQVLKDVYFMGFYFESCGDHPIWESF